MQDVIQTIVINNKGLSYKTIPIVTGKLTIDLLLLIVLFQREILLENNILKNKFNSIDWKINNKL